MKTFSELKKNLKRDTSGMQMTRVAILGDSSTQFLSLALRGSALDFGIELELWESDFDQVDRQIFDAGSELYTHRPTAVIIFFATHKLLQRFNKLKNEERQNFSDSHLNRINELVAAIQSVANARIICYNLSEIDDTVFGNFCNSVPSSFLYQIRKINLGLMGLTQSIGNFYVCDISSVQNRVGRNTMFQSSIYINTEMVLSIDVLPEIAART
ncbi:MAG: hypothetical protein ACKOW8_05780 [Flavobacteriales bacterium]